MGEVTTIYRSAGAEAELLALYDRMLGRGRSRIA